MIAFWLLLLPLYAQADCNNLRISTLQNVDLTNNTSPTESFQVRRAGNGGCQYFATIDNGGASSSSSRKLYHTNLADTLPVQICSDSACTQVIKPIQEASSEADVVNGTFPQGGDKIATLFFRPRLGQTDYERYGTYEANFTMRLYSGTVTGAHTLEDTKSFQIRYSMTKRIDLSLVSPGAPFDIGATSKSMNFGTLSQGQELSFDLVIKTNAGYLVRMASQNQGKLVNGSFSVPYTLTLGGATVPLSSEVTVAQGGDVSGSSGYRLPGKITISALGNAQAGTYTDAVTIRVSTTE